MLDVFTLEHGRVFDASRLIRAFMNETSAGLVRCLRVRCAEDILSLDSGDVTSIA